MQVIDDIFDALGEATKIADALTLPVQTVHSWKAKGSIPPWRRMAVAKLRPVEGKGLSAEALAYLKSSERVPVALPSRPASQSVAA